MHVLVAAFDVEPLDARSVVLRRAIWEIIRRCSCDRTGVVSIIGACLQGSLRDSCSAEVGTRIQSLVHIYKQFCSLNDLCRILSCSIRRCVVLSTPEG